MATAPARTQTTSEELPPDTRGATAPLPATIYGLGVTALSAALGGTLLIQLWYALFGGALTPECIARGYTHYNPATQKGIRGAEGVCHIVTALRSVPETIVIVIGIAGGLAAAIIGFWIAGRQDTVRKREHAFSGAVLGLQAVIVAGFIAWFRATYTLFIFVQNFLNFTVLHGYIWGPGGFVWGARNTLLLALGGEIGGIVIGLTLSLFTLSNRKVVRAPARVYINFFRGTPLIWQLPFFYFLITIGLGIKLGINGAWYTAFIVFSLNLGAYS